LVFSTPLLENESSLTPKISVRLSHWNRDEMFGAGRAARSVCPSRARCKTPMVRALLATALAFAAFGPASAANPPLAGLESLLIPGAGQLSNGDREEAAAHFGVFAVSLAAAIHYRRQDDFLANDERYDNANNREFINRTTLNYDYAVRLATDTALYSSYAAYRDARARDNSGYRRPAPTEPLTDLAAAPFSLRYLTRPTTFIPLAIQAIAAFGKGNHYRVDRANDVSANDLYAFHFIANEMTAVGEEALFRGMLDNEFSDRYGDRAGVIVSSVIFGLSHNGSGQTADALQATAAGLYLGWLHQRNGFEAAEGAALHYWINVFAGVAAVRNGGSAQLVSLHFSF
jgi:CAAX protease family protein